MLVGETYSNEKSSSQLKSSGWSLGIDEEWGPLPALEEGGPDDAVDGYTFRAYFLPVPKPPSTVPQSYWTTELINMLPSKEGTRRGDIVQQMVDPNSGSWRIVFVVTSIEYRSQTIKDWSHS